MTYKMINVPMRPHNTVKCLASRKLATTRTYRLGNADDIFILGGTQFIITGVHKIALEVVALNYYEDEGFDCKEDFIREWCSIHPNKGYQPSQMVYYHTFVKLF